jgi:AraC-like DNA-binding protein
MVAKLLRKYKLDQHIKPKKYLKAYNELIHNPDTKYIPDYTGIYKFIFSHKEDDETSKKKYEFSLSGDMIKEFAKLIRQHIMTESSLDFYAEKLCVSKQYLSLIVKEKTNVTAGRILSTMRTETASRLLRDPKFTIQQIAEMMSFSDQSSFGKFFKKHTGSSPMKYRQTLRKTLLTLRPGELNIKQETLRNE